MSKVKSLIGALAPLAGFTGIGAPLAAAIGAGGGLLSGGGLKGAIGGALGGAGAAGLGGSLGTALTGATGAGSNALGSALIGAAGGGISGGLKGALTGAATQGVGGYLSGGGFGQIKDGLSNVLGTTAGTPLANASDPTQGSGILGSISKGFSNLTGNSTGAVSGGGSSSYGSGGNMRLGDLLGDGNSYLGQDEAKKKLLKANQASQAVMQPYVQSGADANARLSSLLGLGGNSSQQSISDALTSTPGYQFRLNQGQQALERSQAARGGLFSGRALKASQEYGQGLAEQEYQNAVNNLSQQSGQGLNASGAMSNLYSDAGGVGAASAIGRTNITNGLLSSLFGSGKMQYDQYGNPIFM